MRPLHLLLLVLTLGLGLGCPPAIGDDDDAAGDDDDATGDDDDATGDDDDATGDDDDATGDDDDATGDDDDSSAPLPCEDVPTPDSGEWGLLSDTLAHEGNGGLTGTEAAQAWFVPTDSVVDAVFSDFGPISGGIDDAEDLKALFDADTQDLFVVSWIQEAAGECLTSTGVYINLIADCLCIEAHVHRDDWGPSNLPAFQVITRVYVLDDQGQDSFPESVNAGVVWTQRQVPPPN